MAIQTHLGCHQDLEKIQFPCVILSVASMCKDEVTILFVTLLTSTITDTTLTLKTEETENACFMTQMSQ